MAEVVVTHTYHLPYDPKQVALRAVRLMGKLRTIRYVLAFDRGQQVPVMLMDARQVSYTVPLMPHKKYPHQYPSLIHYLVDARVP